MAPTVQDGEKVVKGDALSDEDQNTDGVLADDHDNVDYDETVSDSDSEIEALGRALVNAILDHAPPEDVQKLLDEDEAPLWYQDEDGWSALHAAASVEDAGLVKDLLQRGAPWNSCERSPVLSSHVFTALHPLICAAAVVVVAISSSGQRRKHGGRRCAFTERRGKLPCHSRRRRSFWYVCYPFQFSFASADFLRWINRSFLKKNIFFGFL
jgi:hypothetical protein